MANRNIFERAQQDKFQKAVLVILLPSSTQQEITDHQYTGFVYMCCDLLIAGAVILKAKFKVCGNQGVKSDKQSFTQNNWYISFSGLQIPFSPALAIQGLLLKDSGFPAWALGLSLCLRVMHAPRSSAFSLCLREVVRRPTRACFPAACLFSNPLASPCYSFWAVSCIWPHVNLLFSVQSGPAVLPSGAVLASDLPEHTWSLSFIWSASCIAGHCERSCNRCVFLSNEIMDSLRSDDATLYPLASVPGRLSMTAG